MVPEQHNIFFGGFETFVIKKVSVLPSILSLLVSASVFPLVTGSAVHGEFGVVGVEVEGFEPGVSGRGLSAPLSE